MSDPEPYAWVGALFEQAELEAEAEPSFGPHYVALHAVLGSLEPTKLAGCQILEGSIDASSHSNAYCVGIKDAIAFTGGDAARYFVDAAGRDQKPPSLTVRFVGDPRLVTIGRVDPTGRLRMSLLLGELGDLGLVRLGSHVGWRVVPEECAVPSFAHQYARIREGAEGTQLIRDSIDAIEVALANLDPFELETAVRVSRAIPDADRVSVLQHVRGLCLHAHAKAGSVDEVERLLDLGIDVNHIDRCERTALGWAATKGHAGTVELLLRRGADPNRRSDDGSGALLGAASHGDCRILTALVERGAAVDARGAKGETALFRACGKGHVEAGRLLIASGANVDAADRSEATPLMIAAQGGFTQLVGLLIDAGAEVDRLHSSGLTALHLAVRDGHAQAVRLLLSAGCEVDPQEPKHASTPLHYSALYRHSAVCASLLQAGALVDRPDKLGCTALMLAAEVGDVECMRLLLRAGADPHRENHRGQSAAMIAKERGDQAVSDLPFESA